MKFLSIIFILVLSLSILGQTRKPAVKPAPTTGSTASLPKPSQKVIVEKINGDRLTGLFLGGNNGSVTVETSDAKINIKLSEVRTLRFAEETSQPLAQPQLQVALPPAPAETLLEVEGAIIFKNGDTVPISRAPVVLLDISFVDLLRQAGIKSHDGKTDDQSILFGFLLASIRGSAETQNVADLVKQHAKFAAVSDFAGKSAFRNIPPGRYYLFAASEIRKANVIWNVLIDLKEGQQGKIILDQNNAALAL